MAFPTDWGRRCALVIQSGQVTDNEVNFPLLVTEDTLPSEIFDADGSYPALDGGGDIRFSSDEAGNTQLACEIESFITDNDPANGKAAIWVKVPSLSSSSNTTIYIWYHKSGESQPAEDNAYGKENVWDSNFVMVQHMNQIPDGTAGEIVDSTSNDNDGTTSGMDSTDQVAGQIDGSLDFDGVDDYVDVTGVTTGTNHTITAWIKTSSTDGNNRYIFDSQTGRLSFGRVAGQNTLSYCAIDTWYNSGLVIADGALHFVAGVLSGTGLSMYVDNNSYNTSVASLSIGSDCIVGARYSKNGNWWNGTIDEVRISNVARSAGWIATEYNNQFSPGTFLIEGTPETPEEAPSEFIPQIIMF